MSTNSDFKDSLSRKSFVDGNSPPANLRYNGSPLASSKMDQVNLLPGAINEIIASVTDHHCLTQADRYGLMAAVLDESLNEEERRSIDRLLRSVVRGRVKVVDDVSKTD